MRRLGHLLQQGCTLVLDDLAPLDATMEVACRALSWWASELVRVNTYLTTHDASGTEIVWSGTMHTGDVMHIPRGWWHQGTRTGSGAGFSLHATFGLTQRTGVDWLAWIADQARADELFRHNLNQHSAPDEHTAHQRKLAETAARLVTSHPPANYLTAREHASGRHVMTLGVFGPPQAVVCVTDFPSHLETCDGTAVILAAGKKITVPADALPTLRPLLSGHPASVRGIAAATGINAAALADMLIAEGLCAEITPDLAAGYTGMVTLGSA